MIPFPHYNRKIPYVTTEQMIEVDRAMIEDYKINLIQMMENAGRNLAHLARHRFLDGNPTHKKIVVLAGSGGNGGGALVSARRLHNYGARVQVYVTKPKDNFTSVPLHQFDILNRMGHSINLASTIEDTTPPDLVIDGIIGYSLNGAPRNSSAELIQWANAE